ncbi:hypothetical protein, partial [Thorsellia anophelis]
SLPWSIELLERFENKWDWDCLSRNKSLPWSVELAQKFVGKWKDLNFLASHFNFKYLNDEDIVKFLNLLPALPPEAPTDFDDTPF